VPDVRAVRVEPPRLARRVENTVRARVCPRSGDPLPVARVVHDVAVHEVLGEVRGAEPPVEVQVLDEERRRDEPRATRHPPLRGELSHPRVDERIAGPSLLPRREGIGVVAPAVSAWPQVLAGDPRLGVVQLMMEVAPAQLADPRLSARLARRSLCRLERRDAPEVEVWRETRRAVDGELVPPCVVAGKAVAEPPCET
jgi:hypothetical protein